MEHLTTEGSDIGVSATKEGVEPEVKAGANEGFCGVGSSSRIRTRGNRRSGSVLGFLDMDGSGVFGSSSSDRMIGSDIEATMRCELDSEKKTRDLGGFVVCLASNKRGIVEGRVMFGNGD